MIEWFEGNNFGNCDSLFARSWDSERMIGASGNDVGDVRSHNRPS